MVNLGINSGYASNSDKRMRCTRIKEYSDGVAIGEEHTRHNWCAFSSCRKLHVVDASSLVISLLLLICPSGALGWWKASWLRALSKKVTHFTTVEAWVLWPLSLGWSWCSDICLLLRRPIESRPRGVLLLRG